MQLAPQYYFSNLPPSESKELLQKALDSASTVTAPQDPEEDAETDEEQGLSAPEQRCNIQ